MGNFKRTTTRIMIVGGRVTEDIADTFRKRLGSPSDVRHTFTSLVDNFEYLSGTKIVVDKLVLYADDSMKVEKEFSALYNLIMRKNSNDEYIRSNFFTVSHIFLFIPESDYSSSIEDSFKDMTKLANIQGTDYTITKQKVIKYGDIVDVTVDARDSHKTKNTREVVYATRAGSEARDDYDMDESFNAIVEPFNYDNIIKYKQVQDVSDRVGNNNYIVSGSDNSGDGFENDLVLPKIGNNVSEFSGGYTYIFTGTPKSGTSILATTIARSLAYNGENILMFDLTRTQGSYDCMEAIDTIGFSTITVSLKDIVSADLSKLNNNNMILVTKDNLGTNNDSSMTLQFALNRLRNLDKRKIIIDCDLDNFKEVQDIMRGKISTTICTTSARRGELVLVANTLNTTDNKYVKVLQIANLYNDILDMDIQSLEMASILAKYTYSSDFEYIPMDIDIELFKQLTGEEINYGL